MNELLKAILLNALSEKEKENIEKPITLSFKKGKGLNCEVITEIEGPVHGVITGCVVLMSKVVKVVSPECKAMQKETLEMIYKMVAEKLDL